MRRFRIRGHKIPALGWLLFFIWLIVTVTLGAAASSDPASWYAPELLGLAAGIILGYGYFRMVARIRDRANLFLVFVGSIVLLFVVANVLLLPFATTSNSFNALLGIRYSSAVVGFDTALASFGAPLIVWIGLSLFYAGYKASRTIFVQYG